jgi:hypothetical protein
MRKISPERAADDDDDARSLRSRRRRRIGSTRLEQAAFGWNRIFVIASSLTLLAMTAAPCERRGL